MGDFKSFNSERKDKSKFNRRSYDSNSRGSFRRDSGSRDRRDMPLCDAVCAKCGKDCQVPFKPRGDKPVFCSDCFREGGNDSQPRERRSSSSGSNVSLEQINAKLDKILEILSNVEIAEDDEAILDD